MTFENTQTYIETTYTVIEYVAGHYNTFSLNKYIVYKYGVKQVGT